MIFGFSTSLISVLASVPEEENAETEGVFAKMASLVRNAKFKCNVLIFASIEVFAPVMERANVTQATQAKVAKFSFPALKIARR
jgi:hypothetical protein